MTRIALAFALLVVVSGLALGQEKPEPPARSSDDVLFVLTFGGGGTRAAAFSFGVATALHEAGAGKTSLLERVDRVAGVSGGSLLAAQLAVDASPAGLASFKKKVLLTDIETALFKSAASNSLKMVRADYNRSHAAAAFYGTLYGGANLATLDPAGPELWIQTTDMVSGDPLCFRPGAFAHLGLTASDVSLGTAVAASAAFPGLLPPLTLRVPGHAPAACPGNCTPGKGSTVILADGGISDNLGLEVLFAGGVPAGTKAIAVVVVNSRRSVPTPRKLESSGLISAGMTLALQQRRLDALVLARARERLRVLALEAQLDGRTLATQLTVIEFQSSGQRKKLDKIGTRFDLDESEVELLIREGQAVMNDRLAPLTELFR